MNGSVTYEGAILSGNININAGSEPVLDDITITENGHYTPPEGVDGYDDITVNVEDTPAVLDDITITENGHYTPPEGVDGYDDITVNVPDIPAAILPLNIVSNGTYEAPEGLDGYNPIGVNVPIPSDESLYVELNGVYHPSTPDHRFNEVTVNVPSITMLAKRLQLTNEYGTSLGKVSTTGNFTAGKYYYFLIYNTTSTENINQQGLVMCPNGNFSTNGQTIYVGSYEMLAYPDGIRMVTNPGSEKYIVIFEVPDTALTS